MELVNNDSRLLLVATSHGNITSISNTLFCRVWRYIYLESGVEYRFYIRIRCYINRVLRLKVNITLFDLTKINKVAAFKKLEKCEL